MNLLHIALITTLALCAGCRPAGPPAGKTCKRISLDPATLTVSFHELIPGVPEPKTDYYQPFYRHDGHCTLEHFDTTQKTTPRIRYNALDLDPQHRVISRTKYQILLTDFFGTFYAETLFQYAPFYKRPHTSFRIYAFANSIESEPPQLTESSVPPEAHLSMISVIRVFGTLPECSLICACYAPDGSLLSLSKKRSIRGDCQDGGSGEIEPNAVHSEQFGLPSRFPVAAYSSEGSSHNFLPITPPSDLDCISLHYDRNRFVKQEVIRAGQPAKTRMTSCFTKRLRS
jgi:hypothetical protein